MSGAVKFVKKTFKAVVKTVKKIAPYALAIGAVVMTAGAATGILPSMGAMLGTGGLGLSAGLTSVVGSAITGAGIGGGLGFLTGGKKGLLTGALMGGVTGGALSAIGGAGGAASGAAGAGGQSVAPMVAGGGAIGGQSVAPMIAGGAASGGAGAAAAAGGGGLLSGIASNPFMASSLLQGVGGALTAGDAGKDRRKEMTLQEQIDQREAERRSGNYRVGGGLLTPSAATVDRTDPADRFNPRYYDPVAPRTQYVYDEQLGQVVQRQVGNA